MTESTPEQTAPEQAVPERPEPPEPAQAADTARGEASPAQPQDLEFQQLQEGFRRLPGYARSLLKIKVPVTVRLAATRQSVRQILELAPGSIIQFNKPCDEMLSLEIGNNEMAVGEAVKVGELFGLRVTSMVMPPERFVTIQGRKSAGSAD